MGSLLQKWCGQQDSNLHAFAVEPKSTESTNSTMPAYCFALLFFRGNLPQSNRVGALLKTSKRYGFILAQCCGDVNGKGRGSMGRSA